MYRLEKFTVEGIEDISARLENICSFAVYHHKDNLELFQMIDGLTRIAAMFADIKRQELSGKSSISNPEGYIQNKLMAIEQSVNNYTAR